jgi:hypothetical protein
MRTIQHIIVVRRLRHFILMFLREPCMGIDMVSEEFTAAKFASQEDYAHLMRQRMQDAYRLVHENLKTGFARAKR